jgi:uncharacterized protein (UPF0371 family)
MGVNRAGLAITDDAVVREAAIQEVIRRYFRCRCEYVMGLIEQAAVDRVALLIAELNVRPEARQVVEPARAAAQEAEKRNLGNEGICCGAAIELSDGAIVTGKNSPILHAVSSMVLNAIKQLAGVPDKLHLLAPNIIDSITTLKGRLLGGKRLSLNLDETLIALSISATNNPAAQLAMEQLPNLRGNDVHMTHIPTPGDEAGLKKLGVNATSDPNFPSKALFIE